MKFIAIDVETANPDLSSICQIGIAVFNDGSVVDEWESYINPEDYFNIINIGIHRIDESKVINSPKLPEVANQIRKLFTEYITVSHTFFDRVAIHQAFNKYGLIVPNCTWLDSACVARRTWQQFAYKGYGLYNICSFLGYEFQHHDALEDAKAAGYILNSAIKLTGFDADAWLKRVKQPINPSNEIINREGNPEGPLYGEVLAFTGALDVPRHEAADMAARIGCHVDSGVNKNTTLLVVGDQDVRRLVGHEKSSKHRKVEKLISEGQSIRILRETDFKELVNLSC